MVTIIITAIVLYITYNLWPEDYFSKKYPVFLVIACVAEVFIGIYVFNSMLNFEDYKLVRKTDLVAMNDGYGSAGRFVVTTEEYFFYYTMENGGYEMQKINADGVLVFEDENENPYIGQYVRYAKDWKAGLFGLMFTSKTEIHVPKNSIIRDFTFDLSN